MADPCRCIVPYCRRFTRRFNPAENEWICGDHWRLVPRELRASHRRYARLIQKGLDRRRSMPNTTERKKAAWAECKRIAIERAAGITA